MAREYTSYTDEEIEATLKEMGFKLPDQSYFEDLRQDVNNQDPKAHPFEITPANLSNYLNVLKLPELPQRFRHQPWGNYTIDGAERVLQTARNTLFSAIDHMADLEKLIDDFLYDSTSPLSRFVEIEDQMIPEIPVSLTPYKDQGDVPPAVENKENLVQLPQPVPITRKPVTKSNPVSTPADERRKINQMLKEKCLMKVHPEPGRMPFRVDRVALIKRYEEEWAKHPHPGEAKRLNLRRRIREWMLRRDIPIIKLQATQPGEVSKPDWIE